MANLNLKAGDNITLTKIGEDLEISSNQEETSEIIVSPTEPTTGEEVWIQKGKNLLKMLNTTFTYQTLTFTVENQTLTMNGNWDSGGNFIELPCDCTLEPGTYYCKNITNSGYYNGLAFAPVFDDQSTGTIDDLSTGNMILNITSKTHISKLSAWANPLGTVSNLVYNFQVEQGTTATPYEPYLDKKIYTKNDNGVYEEFYDESEINKVNYSTAEQVIGTDENGNKIYQKTINTNLDLSASGDHNFDIGLTNFGDLIDIRYRLTAGGRKLVYNSAINAIGINPANGYLFVYTGVAWDSSIPFRIVVEYKKTTD